LPCPDPDDNSPPVVGSAIRDGKRQDCVNRANAGYLLRKRRVIDLVYGKSRIEVINYEFLSINYQYNGRFFISRQNLIHTITSLTTSGGALRPERIRDYA